MPDGLAAVAPCCARCRKPLRPGAQFCPSCGCTAAGSAAQAVPFSPPIEPHRPGPLFDSQWREIKQVGWLFALLLGSSLIAGIFARFKPSPWLDVSVSSVDAFIVMVFAYSGFESAMIPGGEIKDPRKTTWRAACLALAIITGLYKTSKSLIAFDISLS